MFVFKQLYFFSRSDFIAKNILFVLLFFKKKKCVPLFPVILLLFLLFLDCGSKAGERISFRSEIKLEIDKKFIS